MNTAHMQTETAPTGNVTPRKELAPALLEELRRAVPEDVRQSMSPEAANAYARMTRTLTGGGPSAEILPGYTIERPIGSGGFGEVFLCEAPGGIKKAIKVVYGTLDDDRAEREMRSLARIKDIRHPFLIGVERIEVVNQQLVFVTELADRSLKDRYNECRKAERKGIPRDELLRYLHDAAEALDYLYEKHTLQHLDVKPENLLLVGDHLKVADFGLLKDLREASVSMVGGVTPLYAPPEVLDGRPSRHSDQYSLAIVYQEMLTGELPFNGRTAGQLAAQHMHSSPVLTNLPTSDRYAISKALSKAPTRRFKSCTEFVDALVNPPKRASAVRPRSADKPEEQHDADQASQLNSPLLRAVKQPSGALPPMEQLADLTGPAVIIGLGGLGGTVVKAVRRRLNERFGMDSEIPSIQLLYVDTEREAISTSARDEGPASLTSSELLATPLRGAQEYRENKKELLSWLSRRWLYNIPRSLRTEGIRPLGRLALVDHAATVKGRIDAAIEAAASPKNVQQSSIATGANFAEQAPRVFVVSSTTGGTGAGMLIDVGYLAQQCLESRKLDGVVSGFAIHGTGLRAETQDLCEVNTVATLGELFHFSQDNERYPGDSVFPAAPAGRAPFNHTYALDFGRQLSNTDFEKRADRLASYIISSTVGASSAFFDRARGQAELRETTVRSFGMGTLGGNMMESMPAPDVLCDAVLARWAEQCHAESAFSGESVTQPTKSDEIDRLARETVASQYLAEAVDPALAVEIDSRIDICKGLIVDAWTNSTASGDVTRAEATLRYVDEMMSGEGSGVGQCQELTNFFMTHVGSVREARVKAIREAVFSPPGNSVLRTEDAIGVLIAIVGELVDAQQLCDNRSRQRSTELESLQHEGLPKVSNRGKKCPDQLMQYLVKYCQNRLGEVFERLRADDIQAMIAEAMGTAQLFERLRKSLESARDGFGRVSEGRNDIDRDWLDRFDERARNDVLGRVGRFWPTVVVEAKHRTGFTKALRQVAFEAIGERCLAISTVASTAEGSDDPVRDAKPMLPTNPGKFRWLLAGPSVQAVEPLAKRIERQFGTRPTIVPGGDGRVTLFCECENLPLANFAREVIGRRPDHLETAERVRSRQDVNWTC